MPPPSLINGMPPIRTLEDKVPVDPAPTGYGHQARTKWDLHPSKEAVPRRFEVPSSASRSPVSSDFSTQSPHPADHAQSRRCRNTSHVDREWTAASRMVILDR
ncbi:hypothetical protein FDECE_7327, partial [Fusarium decemcellulare]